MSSIYDDFQTNESLEEDGVWVPIGDMEFKLKYIGNKNFVKAFDQKARRYRRGATGEVRIPEGKAKEIFYELYAKYIVVDWKGVIDRNGDVLPFSVENCIRIFTDLPRFFLEIKAQSEALANFKENSAEEESGN